MSLHAIWFICKRDTGKSEAHMHVVIPRLIPHPLTVMHFDKYVQVLL